MEYRGVTLMTGIGMLEANGISNFHKVAFMSEGLKAA